MTKPTVSKAQEVKEANEINVNILSTLTGLSVVARKKLEEVEIYDYMMLVTRGPVEVSTITGMDLPKCKKLLEQARKALVASGVLASSRQTAADLKIKRANLVRIPTGYAPLDALLGGGVESGAVTEIYGKNRSGKTQVAMSMATHCLATMSGTVVYIDTEKSFRPERIEQMCIANKFDTQDILERIEVVQAVNTSHQVLQIEEIMKRIKPDNIRLIIVDSVTGLSRSEYAGETLGKLPVKQQNLMRFMHRLKQIALIYEIACFITNQVTANLEPWGARILPVGGNIVGHATNYRLYVRTAINDTRVIRFEKSPYHGPDEVTFQVTNSGFVDVAKKAKTGDDD